MRAILLALLLLGTFAAVAPTAAAHEVDCVWGDFSCWTKCQVSHRLQTSPDHQCRWIFHPGP